MTPPSLKTVQFSPPRNAGRRTLTLQYAPSEFRISLRKGTNPHRSETTQNEPHPSTPSTRLASLLAGPGATTGTTGTRTSERGAAPPVMTPRQMERCVEPGLTPSPPGVLVLKNSRGKLSGENSGGSCDSGLKKSGQKTSSRRVYE